MTMQPVEASQLLPYRVRAVTAQEHGFIFGTWIRSYLKSKWAAPSKREPIPSDDYYEGQLRVVERVLERGVVLVAEHTQYANLFLGFGAAEIHDTRPVLHYLYVKRDYRRNGIARALETALLRRVRKNPSDAVRRTHRGPAWVEGFIVPPGMLEQQSRHIDLEEESEIIFDGVRCTVTGGRVWMPGLAERRGYVWNPYCLYPPRSRDE